MKKKFLFILTIFSIIFVSQISLSQPETKGIVVIAPNITTSDIPYSTETWSKHYVKILETVGSKAKVVRNSPNYAYAITDIPIKDYNQTVDLLRKMGFYVRDEAVYKLLLNESVSAIKAPYTWSNASGSYNLTGADSIITILDSGIDCNHQDFNDCILDNAGKILNWHDAYDLSSTPVDENGHGTFVASVAAGTGDASNGKFKGVAPGAGLRIGRVCRWEFCSERYIADGIDWVRNNYVTDVISIGFGKPSNSDVCTGKTAGPEYELYTAIKNAINSGIVVVAPAGNDGIKSGSVDFPACIDGVIAVGATFKKDYVDYELLNYEDGGTLTTNVHVIVNISGGFTTNYEKEWIADSWTGTGFYDSFITGEGITTVKVRVEGKWKYQCPIYNEGWDPGGWDKGDSYWEWSNSFGSNSYVIIDVGVRPKYETWNLGVCWQNTWNPKDDRIRVRIFSNSYGLKDQTIFWSGRGPAPQGIDKPDFVEPGHKICAARASGTTVGDLDCGNEQYVSGSGTSASTPHVTGLIALLKEANPTASSSEIIGALKRADKIYPYDKNLQGYGRINTVKSVNWITNCRLKSPSPPLPSDSDGSNPLTGGYCKDYCVGDTYYDYCSGNYVYEYYASGNICKDYLKNCKDYGYYYNCIYDSFYGASRCAYQGPPPYSGGGGGGCGSGGSSVIINGPPLLC